ncbi:hypothetical protein ECE50_027215 [Chitinophaga sp. Mgbs1]|uniref:Uncharacterized protein n=1 Tax=Chitinophaga solisilvae TaxID=1233460 RepID=A0A433WHJ9_9BACT|nr:hypothetical protein [Chitinophaga solisilvae]
MKKHRLTFVAAALTIIIAACSKNDDTSTPGPDPDFAAPLFHTLAVNGVPTDSFEYKGGKLVKLWNREPGAVAYTQYYEFIYENNKASGYNVYILDGGNYRLQTKGTSQITGDKVKIYTEDYGPGGIKLKTDFSEALLNTSKQIIRAGSLDTIQVNDHAMGPHQIVRYQQYTYDQHTLKSIYTHYYRSDTKWSHASQNSWQSTLEHSNIRNNMYFLVAYDPVLKLFLSRHSVFLTGPTALTSYSISKDNGPAVTTTYTYTYNGNSQWTEMIINTPAMDGLPATTTKFTATYIPVTLN